MNVELVKILTIFELTGGSCSKEPAKIKSTVLSSILIRCFLLRGEFEMTTYHLAANLVQLMGVDR